MFLRMEGVINAFSYLCSAARPTFAIAGGGELPDGPINANEIIRRGETSPDAIIEKARHVFSGMTTRLQAIGVYLEECSDAQRLYDPRAWSGFVTSDRLGCPSFDTVPKNARKSRCSF
jgi:hypothetical protein